MGSNADINISRLNTVISTEPFENVVCATEPNDELHEDLRLVELQDNENEEGDDELLTVNLTPKN